MALRIASAGRRRGTRAARIQSVGSSRVPWQRSFHTRRPNEYVPQRVRLVVRPPIGSSVAGQPRAPGAAGRPAMHTRWNDAGRSGADVA
jgi:hypothetical protein